MKVVLFGYHAFGATALESLLEAGAEVVGLFTHEDDPAENVWFRTPAPIARAKGIPVYVPEDSSEPAYLDWLRGAEPDFFFSAYYRKLLPEEILRIPRFGALNLHGSFLPKYRGRAPVNWALVNGEKETGVTLHYMTKRADAGDIVLQKRVLIDFEDTAQTLTLKVDRLAGEVVREAYPLLVQGKAPRFPQDESRATKFGRRTPEDGRIDWEKSSLEIYNLVRAVTHPYPGAFTTLRGKKWFVWWARPVEAAAGQLGRIGFAEGGLCVGTAKGLLRVERCQWEGDEEVGGTEFVKKARLQEGEVCGS